MRIFKNWAQWRRLRYVIVTFMAIAPIWFLAITYITLTPKQYSAGMTIILPGDGPNATVNLDQVVWTLIIFLEILSVFKTYVQTQVELTQIFPFQIKKEDVSIILESLKDHL